MNPFKLTILSMSVVLSLTACEDPGKYLDSEENKSVDLGNGWRLINKRAWTVADENHSKIYDKDFKLKDIDIHAYEYNNENYTFAYECATNEFGFLVNLPYKDRKAFGAIADSPVILMSKKNKARHSKGIPLFVHAKNAGDEEISPSNFMAVASMEEMIQKGISLNVSIDEEKFNLGYLSDDILDYINDLKNNEWKELGEIIKEQDEELKELKSYLDKLNDYDKQIQNYDSYHISDEELEKQYELAYKICSEINQWPIKQSCLGAQELLLKEYGQQSDINECKYIPDKFINSIKQREMGDQIMRYVSAYIGTIERDLKQEIKFTTYDKQNEFEENEIEKIRQELKAEFSQRIPANIKIPPIPKVKKFTNGSLCDFKEYKKKDKK